MLFPLIWVEIQEIPQSSAINSSDNVSRNQIIRGVRNLAKLFPFKIINQWWNSRTPVNAIAMPYLSHVSMTWSSRMLPPAWAMYSTPLLCARSILSPKREECVGTQCHLGVAGYPVLSLLGSEWLWLLGKEQLPRPLLQDVLVFIRYIDIDGIVAVGTSDALPWTEDSSRFGHWRNHHSSALLPARRVQWIRLCWPAPMPIACPSLT